MRCVVKIGTSLITDEQHKLNRPFLKSIIEQIAQLAAAGVDIVIVSSGAVAAGRSELAFDHEKKNIPYRQALAAVGQGILMEAYRDFFRPHKIVVSQALLTNFDFVNRENFLNTQNVFEQLLKKGVIPIVNENDVTTIAELKFGDNDMLSAKTAAMISADCLCLLTDVDGLFSENPKNNPGATIIPIVARIDESVKARAGGAAGPHSSGGMTTKIEAAQYVTSVGISMFIVHGKKEGILKKAVAFYKKPSVPDFGTFFPATISRADSRKKWLRPQIKKSAWIEIDEGALKALLEGGKSLLASGVINVEGSFLRGDVVMVKSAGKDIAYGQINYDATDVEKIKKTHSASFESILGYSFESEIIHRDRMVILQ